MMNPFQNKKQLDELEESIVHKDGLYVEDYEGCCTAKILTAFGQEDGQRKNGDFWDEYYDWTEEQIIYRCNELIPELEKEGSGVVVAMTTSNQKEAAKAFTRMGFYTNPKPMKKGRNKKTGDLFIWFMPTHEFKPVKL